MFAGLALSGDGPGHRRARGCAGTAARMSVPASMQWDLLPPWAIRMPGALIAGMLEPAYDVAGDAYDYAAGDGMLHFAVVDGMGHGIGATLLAGLSVGAYRHARRAGAPLRTVHTAIDEALASGYDDLSFVTGLIGTLAHRHRAGCGGPAPGTRRRCCCAAGRWSASLSCTPTVPFGLGTGVPAVSTCDLEPGDAVLLYTDGVTEAHAPGSEPFGLDRLTDLLEREAAGDAPAGGTAAQAGPRGARPPGRASCATTPRSCCCAGRAPDRAPRRAPRR